MVSAHNCTQICEVFCEAARKIGNNSKTLLNKAKSGNCCRPSPMRFNAKQRAGRQESEKLEDIGITYQKKKLY